MSVKWLVSSGGYDMNFDNYLFKYNCRIVCFECIR